MVISSVTDELKSVSRLTIVSDTTPGYTDTLSVTCNTGFSHFLYYFVCLGSVCVTKCTGVSGWILV